MEHVFDDTTRFTSGTEDNVDVSAPGYEAYKILRFGFTVAPIVAGLDKFTQPRMASLLRSHTA